MTERFYRLAPVLFGLLALVLWEVVVRAFDVPVYLVPGPLTVLAAFLADPRGLLLSLASTLAVTFAALIASAVMGGAMALAMSASRLARAAIQPWAVILQVTPIVAIAPLIIVWVGDPFASLVVCAMIVAFFPVFANTAEGLASAPPELDDLFRLYGGSRWHTLILLRLPAALPYLSHRPADFRRARAGGRCRRGVRRGLRRVRVRTGVPGHGGGIPAGNPPHVRGPGAAVAGGNRDQRGPGTVRLDRDARARWRLNTLLIFGLGYSGRAVAAAVPDFRIMATFRSVDAPVACSVIASVPRPDGANIPRSGDATLPRPDGANIPRSGDATGPRSGDATGPRSGDTTAPRSGDANVPRPGDATASRSVDAINVPVESVQFDAAEPAITAATHILVTAPPGETGDPVLGRYAAAIANAPALRWIGYLSSTVVHGDRGGGWVDEDTPTGAVSAARTTSSRCRTGMGSVRRSMRGRYFPSRRAFMGRAGRRSTICARGRRGE